MKDTVIVEVFSKKLAKEDYKLEDLNMANDYIKELASNPSPNNQYELGEILQYVINDGFQKRIDYIQKIADVKNTGIGEKATFKIEIDDLKAFFQAKSATTERSKISSKNFTLETDEISIRPIVDFLDLQLGRVDLAQLAERAISQMEIAFARRVQDVLFTAFSAMSVPNFAKGSGITKGAFDPLVTNMGRVGGRPTIMGDVEAITQFTELAGFNQNVAPDIAVEHHRNGHIGNYLGSDIVQLDNPFKPNSVQETELRKDLVYVIPAVEKDLAPIKVQFEGGVQHIPGGTNIDSKQVEFRFDQYVGVGVIGVRHLLAVYQDESL